MRELCFVGLGGFFGAIARYGLSGLVQRLAGGTFPVGTLAVNTVGCLVIGILAALVEDRPMLSPSMRLFLMMGLLGSFTTFSTFGHETVELLREGSVRAALSNILANVLLGIVAVVVGHTLVRLVRYPGVGS